MALIGNMGRWHGALGPEATRPAIASALRELEDGIARLQDDARDRNKLLREYRAQRRKLVTRFANLET